MIAGRLLCALSIACIALAWGVDRLGHELCHRGFPLAALTAGIPAIGAATGLAAAFLRSSRVLKAFALAGAAANAYLLVAAVLVITGVGIISCR